MYVTLALTGAALVYLSERVGRFGFMKQIVKKNKNVRIAVGAAVVFAVFAIIGLSINFMNAVVCAIYFAFAWLLSDLLFLFIEKCRKQAFLRYYAGGVAVSAAVAALCGGWYLDHNVWKTEYDLSTAKKTDNLKILMFADAHLGTTFDAEGFQKHIEDMQAQNPDVVILAGDFVDDDTTKRDMIAATAALGKMKTKHGVYFVFGNHDKGYYGPQRRGFSEAELVSELEKNGVKVLRDESVLINESFYIIGRRDFSEVKEQGKRRASMAELVKNLDKSKYMIAADHQPVEYDKDASAGVDLVLSGHTHGGQLFPFNQVGKLIGANDSVYGYEKRGDTDFIVTSGISDWAIKFKTGTKSEYVIINLQTKK